MFYSNFVPKTRRYEIFDLKNAVSMKIGLGVRQGGDFSRKSQIFPLLVFCAHTEGVPIGYRRRGSKKLE